MNHTYANRKRPDSSAPQKEAASPQPSMDALRTGAAQPSQEQMGRRVDLPEAIRTKMENAFGADLSAVKLYESQTVADTGAEAIARGADIAFAPGLLDFSSFGGQSLLGHELSHVVSQARGEVTGGGFLNDRSLEARADREGAMAAAGQQVAMPAAAMSPVSAASAAGPMQAKRKPAKTPGKVSFNNMEQFKEGEGDSMSVAGVRAKGGSAVLKTGTNVAVESTLSDYHNMAGEMFEKNHGGKWSFSAPAVRGLSAEEKDEAQRRNLIGTGRGQMHSTSTEAIDELGSMAVYSTAKGASRDQDTLGQTNPRDPKELADYRRMMGYVALTDMVTGNKDRIGWVNTKNWMEDAGSRQVNLIDNDFTQSDAALGKTSDKGYDRKQWLSYLTQAAGKGAAEEGRSASQTFTQNLFDYSNDYTAAQGLLGNGRDANTGVDQAIQDLPAMRKQLQAQFEQKNSGKPLDDYQQELLERMRITHEYMTNPRMAEIYGELAKIGYDAPEDGEDEATAGRRKALLTERDSLRGDDAPPVPFVPGEKTSDQTFSYRSAQVPAEGYDPSTLSTDQQLKILYDRIKNPRPEDDAETQSHYKRLFAQLRSGKAGYV